MRYPIVVFIIITCIVITAVIAANTLHVHIIIGYEPKWRMNFYCAPPPPPKKKITMEGDFSFSVSIVPPTIY